MRAIQINVLKLRSNLTEVTNILIILEVVKYFSVSTMWTLNPVVFDLNCLFQSFAPPPPTPTVRAFVLVILTRVKKRPITFNFC